MSASLHIARFTPRGAGRALRRVRALRATPGLVTARPLMLVEFDTRTGGHPTPLRWGMLCGWKDDAARDAGWERTARFTEGANEAWSVALQTVRLVQGGVGDWAPSTDGVEKLGRNEPLAVITWGKLYARHTWSFQVNNWRVYRELARQPGLGMHIGFGDHPLNRSTFSLWRSQGDVVRAAYGPGTLHNPVQRKSLDVPWGHEWFFARFRPVASAGTWDGVDPLATVA